MDVGWAALILLKSRCCLINIIPSVGRSGPLLKVLFNILRISGLGSNEYQMDVFSESWCLWSAFQRQAERGALRVYWLHWFFATIPEVRYGYQTHFTEEETKPESDAIVAQGRIANREQSWVQTHTSGSMHHRWRWRLLHPRMPSFPSFQGKHAQSSRDANRAVLVGKGGQTGWTGPGRKIPQPVPTVTVTTGTADRLTERLFQACSHPSSRLDLCRSSPYGPPALGWSPPPHSVPKLGCARRRPARLLPMW